MATIRIGHLVAAALTLTLTAVPLAAAAAQQQLPVQVGTLVVGAIHDPGQTKTFDVKGEKALPALPVVYDDAKPAPASKAAPAPVKTDKADQAAVTEPKAGA